MLFIILFLFLIPQFLLVYYFPTLKLQRFLYVSISFHTISALTTKFLFPTALLFLYSQCIISHYFGAYLIYPSFDLQLFNIIFLFPLEKPFAFLFTYFFLQVHTLTLYLYSSFHLFLNAPIVIIYKCLMKILLKSFIYW